MTFQLQQAHADISVASLPPCQGDLVQINQLLSNLLDNAIKYRSSSRPLRIEISGEVEGEMAHYHIRDNGIGISDDCRDKIWEIFYRAAPRGTVTGEGIGLTLVRRIVEKHRGEIQLHSILDEGTTFHLSLPAIETRRQS